MASEEENMAGSGKQEEDPTEVEEKAEVKEGAGEVEGEKAGEKEGNKEKEEGNKEAEGNEEIEEQEEGNVGEEDEVKEEHEEGKGDEEQAEERQSEDDEDEGKKTEEEKTEKKIVKKRSRKVKKSEIGELPSPRTPGSERPTRERKTVERFMVGGTARGSANKPLAIEKGRGTQLKDIPNDHADWYNMILLELVVLLYFCYSYCALINGYLFVEVIMFYLTGRRFERLFVAFKLSKRKADENLQLLHTILFGKKTKVHNLKKNLGLFSGFVWVENEEKQRAKVKDKLDKCVKEKLLDFCDVLNISVNKASVKKEELSSKLLEFLESPHSTTDTLLADKEKGKKRKSKGSAIKSPSSNTTTGKSTKNLSLLNDFQQVLFFNILGSFYFYFILFTRSYNNDSAYAIDEFDISFIYPTGRKLYIYHAASVVLLSLNFYIGAASLLDLQGKKYKQKLDSESGKKRKHSTDDEDDDKSEPSQSEADQDDDNSAPGAESDQEENDSEEETDEDQDKPEKQVVVEKGSSKRRAKKDSGSSGVKSKAVGKGSPSKASKSSGKSRKSPSSVSKKAAAEAESKSKKKAPLKKQKVEKESEKDTSTPAKGASSSKKKSTKSSANVLEEQEEEKSSKEEPTTEEMHAVVVDILKEVDFNTATLSDILRQLDTMQRVEFEGLCRDYTGFIQPELIMHGILVLETYSLFY
ncbi:UNVERIFIED_CONTAM: hypothetical protein Sangu_0088200 [Sesamum angustifolium]|uniref:DEK C-terminal domain-containing protein n=1 Tax=Sesamum angustifolium TaxID=2727405 RepID=A0AAW2RJI3_9LAMI